MSDLTTLRAHLTRRIEECRATQVHWPTGTATHFAAVAVRYELEDVLRKLGDVPVPAVTPQQHKPAPVSARQACQGHRYVVTERGEPGATGGRAYDKMECSECKGVMLERAR